MRGSKDASETSRNYSAVDVIFMFVISGVVFSGEKCAIFVNCTVVFTLNGDTLRAN